jgi:hypothetical protein
MNEAKRPFGIYPHRWCKESVDRYLNFVEFVDDTVRLTRQELADLLTKAWLEGKED